MSQRPVKWLPKFINLSPNLRKYMRPRNVGTISRPIWYTKVFIITCRVIPVVRYILISCSTYIFFRWKKFSIVFCALCVSEWHRGVVYGNKRWKGVTWPLLNEFIIIVWVFYCEKTCIVLSRVLVIRIIINHCVLKRR